MYRFAKLAASITVLAACGGSGGQTLQLWKAGSAGAGINGPTVLDSQMYCAATVTIDKSSHSADDTASIACASASCTTQTYHDGFSLSFSQPTDLTAYAGGSLRFNLSILIEK